MTLAGPAPSASALPPLEHVRALAEDLLGAEGTRLDHVRTAGRVAARLGVLFPREDALLLEAAATLHDIGYAPRISHTGFHPLDGGRFLLAQGFPPRLAGLVANHSLSFLHADPPHAAALAEQFPREEGLLADALAYADMHSAPDGREIAAEHRLADVVKRHAEPRQHERAARLRVALARVGEALLDPTRAETARGVRRHAGRPRRSSAPAVVPSPGSEHLGRAFDDWWWAEARYRVELDVYERRAAADGRGAAQRLAHLRSAADASRDRYFRHALA